MDIQQEGILGKYCNKELWSTMQNNFFKKLMFGWNCNHNSQAHVASFEKKFHATFTFWIIFWKNNMFFF